MVLCIVMAMLNCLVVVLVATCLHDLCYITWSYYLGLLGLLDTHVCAGVCKMAGRVCVVCTCWCDLM